MILDSANAALRYLLVLIGVVEKPDYIYRLVDDHPVDDEIEPNIVYVVGGKGYQKWAYFRCPTDLAEIIQLSLMEKHRPRWSVRRDWLQRPTIHPSIRQITGSFSHFWVKRGKVHLCRDSGKKSYFDKPMSFPPKR